MDFFPLVLHLGYPINFVLLNLAVSLCTVLIGCFLLLVFIAPPAPFHSLLPGVFLQPPDRLSFSELPPSLLLWTTHTSPRTGLGQTSVPLCPEAAALAVQNLLSHF